MVSKEITLRHGTYSIDALLEEIHITLYEENIQMNIERNLETFKIEIWCDQYVDFSSAHSIASLLGFKKKKILSPKIKYIGDENVNPNSIFDISSRNDTLYILTQQNFVDIPHNVKSFQFYKKEEKTDDNEAPENSSKLLSINQYKEKEVKDIIEEKGEREDINDIVKENEENMPQVITIPEGTYELDEIITLLRDQLSKDGITLEMNVNKNTRRLEIHCNAHIDFTQPNSLRSVLGFESGILRADGSYISNNILNVFKVNSIRVECDLITGAFINGKPCHTIHEFFPTVASGYNIVEVPQNVIYFPIIKKNISLATIRFLDESDHLIDFRKEKITCRIHIKRSLESDVKV